MYDRYKRSRAVVLFLALCFLYYIFGLGSQELPPRIPEYRKGEIYDCRTFENYEYNPVLDSATEKNLEDSESAASREEGWKQNWNSHGKGTPRSGVGSTMEATENVRKSLVMVVEFLKTVLKKDKIKILDCPSGDMNWMPSFLRSRNDVDYTGYDIIPMNIENATANFANETWKFKQFDVLGDRISEPFDLVLNRHVNIHLGLLDSVQMYHNIIQSGSKYLMTTTFPDIQKNNQLRYKDNEVTKRKFHLVNVHIFPFFFPQPVCINPDALKLNQHIGLWDLSEFAKFNEENKDRFRPFN